MNIPVELTNATLATRLRIRQLLQASPLPIKSSSAPTLPDGAPPTLWLNETTGVLVLIVAGQQYEISGRRATVVQATKPLNPVPGLEWLNSETLRFYTHLGNDVWFEHQAVTNPFTGSLVNVTGTTRALGNADLDAYLRWTHVSAKSCTVPVVGSGFAPTPMCGITLRNAAATGSIAVTAAPGVTLSGIAAVAPMTTTELFYVGNNTWDCVQREGQPGAPGVDFTGSVVTRLTDVVTGQTMIGLPQVDETIYVASSTTTPLYTVAVRLPRATNSRVGQLKSFISATPITIANFNVDGGSPGAMIGSSPNFIAAHETVTFQCVYKSGSSVHWLRLA